MTSIVAIIPARSGSKSVPDKNILPFCGKPLIAHSIEHGLACPGIDRVIVSTDSEHYADIARHHGAEVPFIRPEDIAGDLATDLDVFTHTLKWLRRHEGAVPDLCVQLRPTYPVRDVAHIEQAIQMLRDDPSLDAVRSIATAPATPLKMWWLGDDGLLQPVCRVDNLNEAYNLPRQLLPTAYLQNAAVDVVRSSVILERGSMTGERIGGLVMDTCFDIDTIQEYREAEFFAGLKGGRKAMKFCFDIDGVLATLEPENRYDRCGPIEQNIDIVNRLYLAGHQITLFTARGTETGIDWSEVTRGQMQRWGVNFHHLKFGKPAADCYIDDRFISLDFLAALA